MTCLKTYLNDTFEPDFKIINQMKRIIFLVVLVVLRFNLSAQENVLDDYIKQGLEENLVIKQNQLAIENAKYALKVAKGMFLPKLTSQSRYTLAQGGRTIDFPIGDLLNPVYSTLNDMIVAQGGNPQFPMVQNESINFLREQEYEAKLSITQAIYYPSISINKRIEEQKLIISNTDQEKYRRELSFSIKEAYYNYMKALQYFDLVQETKEMVNENYRVSEKLMKNDLITIDAVLRAKSEISKVELYESEANKNVEMAKSYFNFLLNKDLNDEIIICSQTQLFVNPEINQLTENAINKRQELQMLNHQIKIMDNVAKLSKTDMLPKLIIAIDYGIQGDEFKINSNSDFIMGSFVLTWDLFNGNTNRNKRKQAIVQKRSVVYKKEEVGNQIKLEVKQDIFEVDQQIKNLKLAETRSSEAKEAYRIIEKRFRLGESALIELLDARTNMTEALAQVIITRYDYLVSIARLEKSSHSTLEI